MHGPENGPGVDQTRPTAPARPSYHHVIGHHVIGNSLGVGQQRTGFAIIRQVVRTEGWSAELEQADVCDLVRLPLGTLLPDTIKLLNVDILPKVRKEDIAGAPEVIVDVSGYGPAAMASFHEAGILAIKATIKGRDTLVEEMANEVTLGKIELLSEPRRLLEHGRLKVRTGLPLADECRRELTLFDPNPPRIDKHDPESWRERPADDLVYAVALAVWWSAKHLHTPKAMESRWNRRVDEYNKQFAQTIL